MGGPYYHTDSRKLLYFPRSMSIAEKISVAFSESLGVSNIKFQKCHGFPATSALKYVHGVRPAMTGRSWVGRTCADVSRSVEARPREDMCLVSASRQERSGEQSINRRGAE